MSNDKKASLMEALEATNALNIKASGASTTVFVFMSLPSNQKFKFGDRVIELNGMPVSQLKTVDGGFFPGGKFGVTEIARSDWEMIHRTYGDMRMIKSGILFAADTLEKGQAMAKERGALRHGLEPIDPTSSKVRSTPKTED